jgi:hypothetical protein
MRVSFSTDMAKLVADQLARFVTLRPHQLAGQAANLDFWLAQIRRALAAIDGYAVRFVRMEAEQQQYVAIHETKLSEVGPAGVEERRPPPPRRIPDRELREARKLLVNSATRFLQRCRAEGMVSGSVVSAELAKFAE